MDGYAAQEVTPASRFEYSVVDVADKGSQTNLRNFFLSGIGPSPSSLRRSLLWSGDLRTCRMLMSIVYYKVSTRNISVPNSRKRQVPAVST